jgi:AcrR family transcriptional regulator
MSETAANRREVILQKAAELFAAKGVAATTVREIADSVGLLSGSLYHHFESKDAIVDELLRSYLNDLLDGSKRVTAENVDPRSKLENLVQASLETVEAHPYATEIYQNDYNLLAAQPRFTYLKSTGVEVQKTWIDVIRAGINTGVFRADIDPQILYRFMRDVVWQSVRWYRPALGLTLRQLANDCTSLLLDGMATKPNVRGRSRVG